MLRLWRTAQPLRCRPLAAWAAETSGVAHTWTPSQRSLATACGALDARHMARWMPYESPRTLTHVSAPVLQRRGLCSSEWPVQSGQELLSSLQSITKNDAEYHSVLCKEVENFRQEYYNGTPTVADDDYDIVYKELQRLEAKHPSFVTEDSPTQSPGPPPQEGSGRQKREHLAPMLGLNNAFNDEDLHSFDSRVTKLVQQRLDAASEEKKGSKATAADATVKAGRQDMVAEMKYDGIAASLIFKEGHFQYAASRGDGVEGEDFTSSFLKYVANGVPIDDAHRSVVLPPEARATAGQPGVVTEIRGELVCSREELERVNALLQEQGEKPFSNPRSVVSGLMNRLQASGGKGASSSVQPRLDMICYSLSFYDGSTSTALAQEEAEQEKGSKAKKSKKTLPPPRFLSSHWEKLETLKKWGFGVCPHATHCASFTEALQFVHRNQTEDARKALPYAADGIVLKVNSEEVQQMLGVIARASRWAVAYKFWSEKASTLLKSIVFQVGRTGKATPVAEIVPVNLGGSMITRATLHNIRFIESNSIEVGSTIVVERSGGTIPKITGLAKKKPAKVYVETLPVYKCPCKFNTTLARDSRGIDLICTSAECPMQNSRAVLHFAQCLGVKGLGGRVVDELLDNNFILSVTDMFFLHERREELAQIPGWGDKKVDNILSQIETGKRNATVGVVMQALGIPSIGKRLCTELFSKYQYTSIWELAEASVEDLQYRGLGKAAAKKLHEYFAKEHSMSLLSDLAQAGLPLTRSDY